MKVQLLECVIEEKVAVVSLNRPPYNPLNWQLFEELGYVMDRLEQNSDVRAVVLTGKGDRAFAAGADVRDMVDLTSIEILEKNEQCRAVLEKMERLSKPIIAAVNGVALGGGSELILACDLRVCSETAKFGFPEINLGIIPGAGGTQRFQRLVGQTAAKELLYFGEMITAERAYEIGLVNKVVPQDELLDLAKAWGRTLAEKPVMAVRMMKKAVNTGAQVDLNSALDVEMACFGNAFATQDRMEGMQSFIEKRKPNFSGV
ncbi:enoyl-CoA hydratase/isomerase family protein [Bacillus thermotolerans]|uniref:enoyl-CoA hydratase/isomerase family protein n=1 Tax=Bacillus thermotolerans TaxID=1221996 RepID=UPI00057F9B6C|nr:enoyl-CoA hydratase-related protein [Bacillus thermotolerans]KKB35205.1 Enoyl-CoA hydratase [Bacillus thermotolerans]